MAPKMKQIADAANAILREHYTDADKLPPTIGDHWLKRLL